jgi:predicted glycoside hydrolase/deacetylase ChbG (UPF0249 family)
MGLHWDGGLRQAGRVDSELLGFAPDARVLILNCDDLGLHDAVNAGIADSIENGLATSCSLISPGPASVEAMRMLRERPHIHFGVHLALIRDNLDYRWGPAAAKADVPSLLDPGTGELYVDTPTQRAALLSGAHIEDVERELRAQIRPVLDAGLSPTHLDWHCLADGGRADVLDLTIALATEYGLAARVWLDDGRATARVLGRPVVDHDFLDSFSIDLDGKAATYEHFLRELRPGLTEWAIHPALGTPGWQAIEPAGWRVRTTDHEFLTSARAREVIAEEGIYLIGYRPLQGIWTA